MFIYFVPVANWKNVLVYPLRFLPIPLDPLPPLCCNCYTYSCLRHVATLSKHLKQVELPYRITNFFYTRTHTPLYLSVATQ